jgi:hypothetical protein
MCNRLKMDRLVEYLKADHADLIHDARRLGADSPTGAGARFGQVRQEREIGWLAIWAGAPRERDRMAQVLGRCAKRERER